MRAVVQRVSSASVSIGGDVAGRIGPGLLVFVGVAEGDTDADTAYTAGKVRDLRVFADEYGRMNRSIVESGGAVLVVSQFTLLGDARKGRRPAFDAAADAETALARYEEFVQALRGMALRVETGTFQAQMDVALVNDGPVTILLDSRRTF